MAKPIITSLACVSVGSALAGCASAPVQTAGNVAGTGAHAIYTTGGDVYSGVAGAAKQPFRDLNMMQDPIPPVLLRAESQPYDLSGMTSCEALMNTVAELDLALGPDVDSPKDRGRDRFSKGADEAASAALEAATSAAEGFLPMRSIIKEVSGAKRYEAHVRHAVLAGTVRRSFLKALGLEHNCGWPAEPLGYDADKVAAISAQWPLTSNGGGVQTASAAPPQSATQASPQQAQTIAVATAVSPTHPNVQAIAVSTSSPGAAPVTHVYMVANHGGTQAGSTRTVTVSSAPVGFGAQSVRVSAPTMPGAAPGTLVATATTSRPGPGGMGVQTIAVTAPTSAPGSQTRAVVATSTLSAPNAATGGRAVQTVSVSRPATAAGLPGQTVVASSPVSAEAGQTLTVSDPLSNAAPSARVVAAAAPRTAQAFASRSVVVSTTPAAYRQPAAGSSGAEPWATPAPTAVAPAEPGAPWVAPNPGGR